MSCPAFEERIARYIGGDLPPAASAAIVEHLSACAACAQLAADLEEDRRQLSLRPPDLAAVDFAALRGRIRAEVSHPRNPWRWLPAWIAAAAALVATVVAIPHRAAPPHTAPALAPIAHVAPVAPPAIQPAVRRPHPTIPARVAAPTADGLTLEAAIRMFEELQPDPEPPPMHSDSPVEMRIATGDPSVTIILLQESKGDSQ